MLKTLFSFILIGLIFLSSLGLTAYRVKDPEFINEQVRSANLYGRLSSNLPKILPEDFVNSSGMSAEDLADVITAAIDSQVFYGFVDQVSRSYLNWLSGESSKLDFSYDLTGIKTNSRDKAVDRMLVKYSNLPTCDSKQIKTWSADKGLPVCQLPSTNTQSNDIARLFSQQIDRILEPMPNTLAGKETTGLLKARERVLSSLGIIRLLWIASAAFILLFLLIYRRHGYLTLAFIFLLTGLIEAGFSLIAWDWVGKLVVDMLPDNISPVLPLSVDLIAAILDVLKKSLSRLSIVLMGVGVGFLLLWIFHRPKPKTLAVAVR